MFTKPPNGTWVQATSELDLSWKETILPILEEYTDRTPGSWVEHKQINLAWHYRFDPVCLLAVRKGLILEFRNAEQEYASEQAKDLVMQLEGTKLPIEVLRGKKTVEVRPRGINKVLLSSCANAVCRRLILGNRALWSRA